MKTWQHHRFERKEINFGFGKSEIHQCKLDFKTRGHIICLPTMKGRTSTVYFKQVSLCGSL